MRGFFFRRVLFILILVILAAFGAFPATPTATAAADGRLYQINIAAGPAHETMTRLAEITNTQLLFPYDQVKDIRTNAVRGRYNFRQALELMLQDTPLDMTVAQNGAVHINLATAGTGVRARPAADNQFTGQKQQDPARNGSASDSNYFIEEISVTARKRLESIREVPFSVAAKTSSTIFLSGAQDFSELARSVSGLFFADLGPGQSQIAIRGISAGQVVRDQPGVKEQVGVYLDESVISMALFTPDLDLFDLNRVEVLRGPQGTLYGSGSLSGTVRYISNAPDLSRVRLISEATVKAAESGDWATNLKMAVNLPLIEDKAAVRLVGYYNDLIGYVDARQPDGATLKNVNDGDKYGGRLALALRPNEQLSITPRLVIQRINTNGFPRVDIYNVLANPFTESRPKVTLGPNEQFTQLREGLADDFLLADLQVEYDFTAAKLTAITSYIDREITVVRDSGQLTTSILTQPSGFNLSGVVLDQAAPLIDQTDLHKFSQEIRLNSTDEAPLQYVVGAFYTTSDRKYGQNLQVDGFENLTGLQTTRFLTQPDILYFSSYDYDFRQWALFGEATYALTRRLKVTGGLRWFEFRESRHMILDGLFPVSTKPEGLSAKTVSRGLTPRIILAYTAADNIQINAQIAKGFRLGGINDPLNKPLCTPEDFETFSNRQIYDNEELWNYEIGFKSSFNDGKATFDASLFYADIHDLQATVDAGSCSSRIIFNLPRARSIGIETELHLKPHPDLDITFSASVQDATIRSTIDDLGSSAQDILSGIKRGNRLPSSPAFQAATQIIYYWDMRNSWGGFASLNLYYVGSSYTQIKDQVPDFGAIDLTITQYGDPNTDSFTFDPRLPAYKTGNIRIGVRQENLELSLFVSNIWNERIRTSLDRERGGLARVGHMVSPPRTFGLTLRSQF